MKRIIFICLFISLLFGCSFIENLRNVTVDSVSLNETSVSLNISQSVQLEATVSPANSTNKNILWSSSNEDIATVNKNGKVTAKSLGEAVITVTTEDQNKTASCKIIVNPVNVTGISINETSKNLMIKDEVTLTATVNPENATNKTISWSSSNEEVATVDENGKVTAKSLGEAIITVTSEDQNKTAACDIKVTTIDNLVSCRMNTGGLSINGENYSTLPTTFINKSSHDVIINKLEVLAKVKNANGELLYSERVLFGENLNEICKANNELTYSRAGGNYQYCYASFVVTWEYSYDNISYILTKEF